MKAYLRGVKIDLSEVASVEIVSEVERAVFAHSPQREHIGWLRRTDAFLRWEGVLHGVVRVAARTEGEAADKLVRLYRGGSDED